MADIKALKSYLVGLGFKVDAKQYRDFDTALINAARSVKRETASIGVDLLKWQVGLVGFFTSVSGSVLAVVSQVAKADQEYRLFGERMFMSTQNARSLKIALDALGQPLEAVAFDPELNARFKQLQKDQLQLSRGLGGDFEGTMKQIRDVEFELTRMRVEFQFFVMGFAKNLSQLLFGDTDILQHLRDINAWIIQNIPQWSRQFAQYLLPVLKDTWAILKDVWQLLGLLANEFTNIVSTFSGDDSLRSATFDFDKFARAVGTAVHGLAELLEWVLKIERKLPVLEILGGAAAGGALGSVIPGVGTGVGAAVGGVTGGILGLLGRTGGPVTGGAPMTAGATVDAAREAAKIAGAKLGVDPAIIFAQWAHETGNFTNRGAKTLNNFAGINVPGGHGQDYRSFSSPEDFANYYADLIQRRYKGSVGATSIDQFAEGLSKGSIGSWFDLSKNNALRNYEGGMRRYSGEYGKGSTQITVGDINIMQPNATADEIARTVTGRIADQQSKTNQRNLTQLQPVFQ